MNLITGNEKVTMTSLEIAELMKKHLSKIKTIFQNVAASVVIGFVFLACWSLFLIKLAEYGW